MANPGKPPLEKLLARLEITENGCWITSRIDPGYSKVYAKPNRILLGHRVMWEQYHGPIPDGLNVHHECHNKACVNPDHLALMDHDEHCRHHYDEPGGLRYTKPVKTHCPHGHPYDEVNTLVRRDGSRACRECLRLYKQRRRRANGARAYKPRKSRAERFAAVLDSVGP